MLHDFLQGVPYTPSDLPLEGDGDRLVVCLDCAQCAEKIIRSGLPFVAEILREAKRAVIEENSEPLGKIIKEYGQEPSSDSAKFLEFWSSKIDAEPWQPGDDELLAAYEEKQLLKHYRKALDRHVVAQIDFDKRLRRARSGLQLVQTVAAQEPEPVGSADEF